VSGTTKGTFSDLTNTSPIHDAVNLFLFARDDNDTVTVKPKAYINWIAFDDHLAPNSFGAIPVGAANTLNTLSTSITASQNGYFYIYVSYETQNWDVFFDNLVVNHRTGPLLEEYHYYPFGLTMAGISDKALKSNYAENKKRFAHQDFENDLDWDMYLFRFRAHDPQIGRFIQIDPLAKSFPYNSTYAFAENRVGNGTDLEGLEWWASPLVFGNNTTILRGPVLENAVEATVEAGAKISEVGGKVSEGTTKPKFSPEQLQRFREGRKIEAEQLEKNGLEKNNKPIEIIDPKTGKTGETVPDAFKNDGQSTVEIKNVKSQGLSRQLRLQQKYSNDNGFNPELIINKGAQISKPLQNSTFDIKYYNSVPPAAKDAINQGLPKAKPVPEKPVQPASKPCTCGTPCCI
jgi:RHS repeat-associated protein